MKTRATFKTNYRNGWKTLYTWREPSLTFEITRAGWTGDTTFELDHELPLGAEILIEQIENNTPTPLWLGTITERALAGTGSQRTTAYRYRARGISEHFLDLPFAYHEPVQAQQRNPSAQTYWEFHLRNHLKRHTPRYTTLYKLSLASLPIRDLAFKTIADLYQFYQAHKPCRIKPQLLTNGRIRMTLEDLPTAPYIPPRDSAWQLTETTRETATRFLISNPARQLVPDRRVIDPQSWQLVVPTGATATITPQDTQYPGYMGGYATSVEASITLMVWVGIQLREKLRAPKTPNGNYDTLAVGFYAKGDNATVRLNINGASSSTQTLTSLTDGWTELAWQITPAQDELTLTIELQPTTPTLPATLVIDGVYAIAGAQPLSERDIPPTTRIVNEIPSYLTAGVVAMIDAVVPIGGGVYDIVVRWEPFTNTIAAGAPVQVLQQSGYLTGQVVSYQNPQVLRVQLNGAPASGDTLYVMHGPAATAERDFDTLYRTIETPTHITPEALANLIETFASPSTNLTLQIPNPQILPEVGQTLLHPLTGQPLTIHSVRYALVAGDLTGLEIQAGTPEPTLRAILRRLAPVRYRGL